MWPLKLLFSFKGRIGRQDFWAGKLLLLSTALLLKFVFAVVFNKAWDLDSGSIPSFSESLGIFLMILCYVYCLCALYAKRWHDRNKSGAMTGVILIPFVGIAWCAVELSTLKGTEGPNDYGDDPVPFLPPSQEDEAQQRLLEATRFERKGDLAGASIKYREVIQDFPETGAAKDAAAGLKDLQARIG